ncbi:hypothetical protein Aduo_019594 [Ancylostoma duodenale]
MTGYQVVRYDSTNNCVDDSEKIPPVSQEFIHAKHTGFSAKASPLRTTFLEAFLDPVLSAPVVFEQFLARCRVLV